jgi:uncharacterized protein (TIGR02118 family)
LIKLTMCVRRLPHLTREQFDAYWKEQHGPLVRSHQSVLKINRYVQTSPLSDDRAQEALRQSRDAESSVFDGCAELWWDSLETLASVRRTTEGAAALRALLDDERKFIDLARSQLWYGTERCIIGA